MGRGYRPGRLGEEIRRIVSELLLRELKDPRLSGIVSVTAVEVTADAGLATLFVTVLGDTSSEAATPEKKKEVLEAFQSAKGRIRKEIGHQIKLRHVPDLLFKIDTSEEYGRQIESIIADLGIRHEDDGKGDPDEEL